MHRVAVPLLRLCVVALALVGGVLACAAVVVGAASLADGGDWAEVGAFIAGLVAATMLVVAGVGVLVARSLRRQPRAGGLLAAVLGVGIAYTAMSVGLGRIYERPVLDLTCYAVAGLLLVLGLLVAATSPDD